MTDINSIIEMIDAKKYKIVAEGSDKDEINHYGEIYNEALNDIIEQLRKMSATEDAEEPAQHILEEWDSMCAKANKSLHSDCPLLEDEVLSEMHKYVGALMIAKNCKAT